MNFFVFFASVITDYVGDSSRTGNKTGVGDKLGIYSIYCMIIDDIAWFYLQTKILLIGL